MEELRQGRDDDPLIEWIEKPEIQAGLLSKEAVDEAPVRRAIAAYAPALTDNGLEQG